jgi:formate--tetrahydrofolate ligase
VTEAGFAFELGAEKFFDINCRYGGFAPSLTVLVATLRALKMHGGVPLPEVIRPDPDAVAKGLPNLEKHIESIRLFGEPPVVALNRFGHDVEPEIEVVRRRCAELQVPFAIADHFVRGGDGALDLARAVVGHAEKRARPFRPLYSWDSPVADKILAVAQKMYGAKSLALTAAAQRDLKDIERLGYDKLPVCIAKTQNSLSDDPGRRGRPTDFVVTVRGIQINAGAGFLVVLTGDIMRMPGLPKTPLAESIDLRGDVIIGLQ